MRRFLFLLLLISSYAAADPRLITNGWVIPDEGYADQPYVVKTRDGNWLCVITTGPGHEGQGGQHTVALISSDKGRTWSQPIDIEPGSGPEASWVVPLIVPSGRVYAIYTYNRDNIREVPQVESEGVARRVDTLGVFAFRYSDDHGRSWSARHEIPQRPIADDSLNNFGGSTLFFWSVAKPVIDRGAAYIGFARVTRWGMPGTLVRSRGFFLYSENILTERDPKKIRWEMRPDGDTGLVAPKGPISEETNVAPLSDGSLYAVYRTIDGYICHAYSRDRGRTWTGPEYATYSPGGRRIKHPRAASFVRRFSNGKYLLWYHNHGGEAVLAEESWPYYMERNPGWVAGGIEKEGHIYWSEPEILLYDDDPAVRMSYPDFIEDDSRFYITETQKTVARVHEIDRSLLEGLWGQFEKHEVTREGLALSLATPAPGAVVRLPRLPDLGAREGFTFEFELFLKELSAGQVLLDTRDASGRGLLLKTSNRFSVSLTLSDGVHESTWDSDPGTHPGTLKVNHWHHIAVTVDGGPKIITWIVDGVLNDGGAARQFGWSRFRPEIRDVNGKPEAPLAAKIWGELRNLRVYTRALRTSEVVGNYRSVRRSD